LKPHEPYTLSASGDLQYLRVHFKPYASRQALGIRGQKSLPRPFKVFVNNVEPPTDDPVEATFEDCGGHSTNWTVEVRPNRGSRPVNFVRTEERWSADEENVKDLAPGDGFQPELGPGRDTNAAVGAFRWAVNLGRLWNGQACGLIRLNERTITTNLFTAAPLTYTVRSTNLAELWVITNASGDLRQIRAPQALVDIQATNQPNEQCALKFYLLSQVGSTTNGSGLFPINDDNPFVTWRVKNPNSPGTYTRALLIEERPGGRNYTNEIKFTSASNLWSLVRGQGNETRTETRAVSISAVTNRTETVEINSTATAYKAVETYSKYPWGWELVKAISNPGTYGLTNTFDYYTNTNEDYAVEYRKLKAHWYPGGRWQLWYYGGNGECPSWPYGSLGAAFAGPSTEVRVQPWIDGPADPANANFTNAIMTYTDTYHGNFAGHEMNRRTREFLDDPSVDAYSAAWTMYQWFHDSNVTLPTPRSRRTTRLRAGATLAAA
jgi:hypothetical protein